MKQKNYLCWVMTAAFLIAVSGCIGPTGNRVAVPDYPPPLPPIKPVKVAVVLSSGGFRGGAHLGALEVLEKHKVPIDLIVGSSAGSFIGALYADKPNAEQLKKLLLPITGQKLLDTSWRHALCASFCPTGPIQGYGLQKFLLKNMRSRNFSELKIPLIITATNVATNQLDTFGSGPIVPAVHASSAMPPFFAPVRVYQQTYIDGGVMAPVPVMPAKQYAPKFIIAVDITKQPSFSAFKNAFELTNRAVDLSYHQLAQFQAQMANIVIRPDLSGYGTFEDQYNQDYYFAGKKAAEQKISEILEQLKRLE